VFHAKRAQINAHLAHLQAPTHMLILQLAKEPNFADTLVLNKYNSQN